MKASIFEAANQGSTFLLVVDSDGQPVTGRGKFSESYSQVEGRVESSASGSTPLLQNPSSEVCGYDPTQQDQKPHPTRVDLLVGDHFVVK